MKRCDRCGEVWSCDPRASIHKANDCNGNLIEISLSYDDYRILCRTSNDMEFVKAMVDLKEKDIIEYNLKMSQFRTQVQQQKSSEAHNDTTPRCPHCHSSNIKPISGLNRGASIAVWGVFSKKINKSFECKSCGYTW